MNDEEKLGEARTLITRAITLCDELRLPLAANYIHLGLELVENRADPARLQEVPMDLRKLH